MTFFVHLSMSINEADSPESAVQAMIEQLVAHGLRQWTYQVDAVDGDGSPAASLGLFSGYGAQLSGNPESPVDSAMLTADASDAELLAYAERLNAST